MNIMTLREENKLSLDELDSYYNELRQYAQSRKLTNTTCGATIFAPKLKAITNIIADRLINVLAGGKVEKISDGQNNIPEGPVIFAHTHQGILDNFSWIPVTPKHALILHATIAREIYTLRTDYIGGALAR